MPRPSRQPPALRRRRPRLGADFDLNRCRHERLLHFGGLATVLFTDIVGSTERAAGLGDEAWRDLLDRHDRVVRRQIERFRSRELNTVGDRMIRECLRTTVR